MKDTKVSVSLCCFVVVQVTGTHCRVRECFFHGSDDWRRGTDLSWIMGAECKLVLSAQLACGWLAGNRFA